MASGLVNSATNSFIPWIVGIFCVFTYINKLLYIKRLGRVRRINNIILYKIPELIKIEDTAKKPRTMIKLLEPNPLIEIKNPFS